MLNFQSYQGSILTPFNLKAALNVPYFQSYQGSILTLQVLSESAVFHLSILSRFNFNNVSAAMFGYNPVFQSYQGSILTPAIIASGHIFCLFQSYQGSILTREDLIPGFHHYSFNPIKVQF